MSEVALGDRIAEKVKAKAKARGQDVPQALQKLAQERIACRLYAYEESEHLVVTGGCLYHWCPTMADMNRPTADIDLHSYECETHDEILNLFKKAFQIEDNDGWNFEVSKTTILEHEHGEYNGLRVHIVGHLGRVRVSTYADVGLGGEPPVGLRELRIRPQIEGQSSQTIKAQPFEYSIAEKLHSIVVRGLTNTRLKDYRDLFVLSRRGFDGETIRAAVEHTFRQRSTELPARLPVGLSAAYANVRQADWQRHLKKSRITGMPQDLGEIVDELADFYGPLLEREPSFTYTP